MSIYFIKTFSKRQTVLKIISDVFESKLSRSAIQIK